MLVVFEFQANLSLDFVRHIASHTNITLHPLFHHLSFVQVTPSHSFYGYQLVLYPHLTAINHHPPPRWAIGHPNPPQTCIPIHYQTIRQILFPRPQLFLSFSIPTPAPLLFSCLNSHGLFQNPSQICFFRSQIPIQFSAQKDFRIPFKRNIVLLYTNMSSEPNSHDRLSKQLVSGPPAKAKPGLKKPNTHRKSLVDNGLLPASWEEAQKFRKRQSNQYHNDQKVSFFVDTQYFKQYGPGTYLFFLFSSKLMKVFIIMSLLSIPTLYTNFLGDGMSSIGTSGAQSYLMGFSLGNQLTNSTYYLQSDYKTEMQSRYRMIVIPDFLYSFVFLIFLFYWEYTTNRVVREMKESSDLPSYYCVTVQNLPEDVTEEEVRQYMSQFGDIKEISEVRDYDETINLSRKIYEKNMAIKEERWKEYVDDEKIESWKKDIDEHFDQLKIGYVQCKTLMYFVSFRSIKNRDQAVKSITAYSQSRHRSALRCGCESSVPSNLLIRNQLPDVRNCTVQPGSIIWENIHLSTCSRLVRWIFQTLFILAASFLSFIALSMINIATPQTTTSNIDASAYSYSQVILLGNATITQAWCLSLNPVSVYSDSSLQSLCLGYVMKYYSLLAIGVSISVGVVVVKLILQKVVEYISKFQRHSSYSDLTSSLTLNYFCIYFITTFILPILLQAQIGGISFKDFIPQIISNPYLISNSQGLERYKDFTRQWYSGIGYKICLTWIISSLVPHVYDPFVQWVIQKIKECRAKTKRIQKGMNETINPSNFAFEQHYANMLLIVFGALVLGGPIPFLLVFATIALATKLIYWRIMFIRFARVPPTFDQSLNNTVLRLLPWALILHCAISIWSYGADSILPGSASVNMMLPDAYYSQIQSRTTLGLFTTLLQRMNFSFLISAIGVLTLVVTISKLLFYDSIVYLIQSCRRNEPLKLSNRISIIMDADKNFIKSYQIEKNHNYDEIVNILKSAEVKKTFDEV